MRRRRAILASVVAVASVVACGRTGDRVMQTFEGPVKIENVQRYAPPNMCTFEEPVPSGYPRLVVHDDRTFEIESTQWCHQATVKQHGPKKLIALYCPTKYGTDFEEWRIFRRLGEGNYIEDCRSKGPAPPDLDRVGSLAESAVSLVKCSYGTLGHGSPMGNKHMAARYRLIADALAKTDGAQAVAKMLEQTLDVPPLFDSEEDGWVLEVGRLESGVRPEFLGRICRALERGDSSDLAYTRTARVCPLDGDTVRAAAIERAKRVVKHDLPGDDYERGVEAKRWANAILARSPQVGAPTPRPRPTATPDAGH